MHQWKHQALIDAGLVDGIDSTQSAALRAAHKRIKFLEKELQLVKDASEIYDSLAVVDPKEGRCVTEELVSRGTYGYRRVAATLGIESALIVNHKPVAGVMQELQLHGLPKRLTAGVS